MSETIVTTAENWLISICLKRGVTGGVLAVGAYFGTHEIGKVLPKLGVTIDWNVAAAGALTLIVGGLHMLHDYLKVKKGMTWL